jgi:hypothetical protein
MDAAMSILLFLVPAAAAVVAAGLLVHAFRGRRVDDHPVCRQCGFDLVGKPHDSTVCPECGSDLSRPRAVRVGRRETRRGLVKGAAPLLLVSLGLLGVQGWGRARGVNWNRQKPAWWLTSDARGTDVAARDAALGEMVVRLRAGDLSQHQIDALADLALDLQADASRPWSEVIGDAIGAARDAGKLSPQKWQRYARQATVVQFRARPTLRRGDRLIADVTWPRPRMSPRHRFLASLGPSEFYIGAKRVGSYPHIFGDPVHPDWKRPMVIPMTVDVDPEGLAALGDGTHIVRCVVRLQTRAADAGDERVGDGQVVVEEPVELRAPVTLVPAGAQTVRLNTDPSLRGAVEQAVMMNDLWLDYRPDIQQPEQLRGYVRADRPPTGLAFRVLARVGDREWDLGPVMFAAGTWTAQSFSRELRQLPGFPAGAKAVDVVLRPSPADAVNTLTVEEVWTGGEVLRKAVPIVQAPHRRLDATPPPSPMPL